MQYLAICEDDLLFQFMRNVATEQGDVRYLVPNAKIAQRIRRQQGKVWHGDLLKEETYKKIKLHHVDQAIVFVRDADEQERACRVLRGLDKNISIVSLTSEKNGKKKIKEADDPLLRHLQLADIFAEFCATQLLDTLDTFVVVRDGDIILKLHPDEAAVMREYAMPLAQDALKTLSRKYRFTPKGPILVEMFPSHDDFAVRTLGLPGLLGALGACFGRVVTLDSPRA